MLITYAVKNNDEWHHERVAVKDTQSWYEELIESVDEVRLLDWEKLDSHLMCGVDENYVYL